MYAASMSEPDWSVPTFTGWKGRLIKPVQIGGGAAKLPRALRRRLADTLRLRPGQRVLEYGCGDGPNLRGLQEIVGSTGVVVGVESAAVPREKAARRVAREGWVNVTVVTDDEAEVVQVGRFDAVLFNLGYSLLPDRDRLLDQAWSLVRDGGRMVVVDCGATGPMVRKVATLFDIVGEFYGGSPDAARWAGLSRLSPNLSIEFGRAVAYCTVTIEKAAGTHPTRSAKAAMRPAAP